MSDGPAPDELNVTVEPPALATVIAFPSTRDHPQSFPVPLSSFVGRQHDLARVVGLLTDSETRLLTLTGPGGIGKTRLAMAAAAAAADMFSDGVAFVALDAARQVADVLPALAQAMGIQERSDRDPRVQVRTFLERMHLLLVLDNFEQILAAGPDVVDLLVTAPNVTALITSRAPLRVDGERVLPVPPLTLASAQATAAELLASDAGRLFIERARARDPDYALDDQSAAIIATICTQLDGLPLAIELAAAHANMLPPRQLRARLERRLPLLTRGARDAPPRHGAIRNTIAWSYDLLSSHEQRLYRQLAVFVDGCTLPAAEWMCADPLRLAPNAFETVASLVDQSLVIQELGKDGEPRLRMLETIREFGLEQLAAEDEEHDARARHARYFLAMARALRPLASVHARKAPLEQLQAEHANLQQALRWFEVQGPAADFVELVAALALSWYSYGSFREGQPWLERAMTSMPQAASPDQARLLIGFAGVRFAQGDFESTKSLLAQGFSILGSAGDPLDMALAFMLHGAVLASEGRYEEAETPLGEALALADHIDDHVLRAGVAGRALANLAGVALGRQDFTTATARGEEALLTYHNQQFDLAESLWLMDLGTIAHDAGDHELAAKRWSAGIALMGDWGELAIAAELLSGIACVATTQGAQRVALLLFGAAEAERERVGSKLPWPPVVTAIDRSLAALRNDLGESAVAQMLASGRAMSMEDAVAIASEIVQRMTSPAEAAAGDALTRRESEVLCLLAEQHTDQEIADLLFLSRRTVSWHVRSILAKLDATSRDDAIASARGNGLV